LGKFFEGSISVAPLAVEKLWEAGGVKFLKTQYPGSPSEWNIAFLKSKQLFKMQ